MQIIFNKKLNKKGIFKIILFILISSCLILPFLPINTDTNENNNRSRSNDCKELSFKNELKTQHSKDDYEPILEYEQSALGSINVSNIEFNREGFNNYTTYLPELDDDITSKALNMSYIGTKFVKVVSPAIFEDYNKEEISEYGYATELIIRLNDTISVQYDESIHALEGYLFYKVRIAKTNILELWIENKSLIDPIYLTKVDDVNCTKYGTFMIFYYKNYLTRGKCNFTMHLIYDLKIFLDTWNLNQDVNQELVIDDDEKAVSPRFTYSFKIYMYEFEYINGAFDETGFAKNLKCNLTIFPPNRNLLYQHSLTINNEKQTGIILNQDNSIYTGFFDANFTQGTTETAALIELEFFATFIMDFEDPVDFSWSIDRLVADDDIRERIYFPIIVSGPSHIYLKNVKIVEDTIAFDQVISGSSIFERPVLYTEINVSQTEEETGQSLIFNEITTKRRGIKITMPYMILGEICPFIIKYETESSLKIVITDNIGMPVSNLEVEIYYFGEEYGTYISNEKTQPLGHQITDENGEILLEKVPDGNYTVKVYYFSNVVKESEVSTFLEINYVPTPIIHIPIVVLIFGSIFGFVLIIGLLYRLRQEKRNQEI